MSGELIAQAACLSMSTGTWTFAIPKQCSGGKTCTQVCADNTESQAGALQCYSTLHLYSNQPHDTHSNLGLKVHRYANSCESTDCGPNYCCCDKVGQAKHGIGLAMSD